MRTLIQDIVNKEGEQVELYGWIDTRRDHGKIIFIDLRDRSGVVQVVFGEEAKETPGLRQGSVVRVVGEVKARPENMVNDELATGAYEVKGQELEMVSPAQELPMPVDGDGYEIGEDVRLQYRYLDLRRLRLQENLRKRSQATAFVRNFLRDQGFVEVETPILSKSTPEGARDFLVPSRKQPGKFYALPQSPQQYKQLLMVSGLERYFQIVRCFRDEDTRGDRQPEFTQVDVELSFTSQEEVISITEELFLSLVKKLYPEKKLTLEGGKVPRMTYAEAMEQYDSDRPDVRKDKEDPNELAFLWVTDFPAFEQKEGKGNRWAAVHHPFTMPDVESVEDFKKRFADDPSSIRAKQYDLVLNGYEIAGGSIRVHDGELLEAIFEVLGHSKADVEEKFGHLIKAFQYGVPPHGGIAPGFDRVMMVLQGEPSIREVIAFPKTGDGRDLMMESPAEVDKEQLDELGIQIKKSPKSENN